MLTLPPAGDLQLSTAPLEPGTSLLGALETQEPSFPPASADRACWCQHFLLTLTGHHPGDWDEHNDPGMEENGIWPFHCVHKANGQLMTIMGIHSRTPQWNQRPRFALKMGNQSEPALVCCIYFQGELSKTTTICLSCVCTKQKNIPLLSLGFLSSAATPLMASWRENNPPSHPREPALISEKYQSKKTLGFAGNHYQKHLRKSPARQMCNRGGCISMSWNTSSSELLYKLWADISSHENNHTSVTG